MRLHVRIPRFFGSTIETRPQQSYPVLDGRDVIAGNRWKLPPHTVAMIGRPAVRFSVALELPRIPLGFATIAARKLRFEQDFGGHLFLTIADADAQSVRILEAGPLDPNGHGALVPYAYPEEAIAADEVDDFAPIVITPPNGLTEPEFAELLRTAQRSFDGDQRYVAIKIPFLLPGRDSNSYVAGILLCAGVDARAVAKPTHVVHREWTGYPGAEDPVHLSNFGTYLGTPTRLASGAFDLAYHNDDGSVRFVVVGGEPHATVQLPDGSDAKLDERGRIVFTAKAARAHGLPSHHTEPPANLRSRQRFPADPAAAGGFVTVVVGGVSAPLEPRSRYTGRIVVRNDALGVATLRTATADVILPIGELGVELRDPKRVDQLFRVGNELTLGLHADRYPKLVVHGPSYFADRLQWRRFHAPRPLHIAAGVASAVILGIAVLAYRRR